MRPIRSSSFPRARRSPSTRPDDRSVRVSWRPFRGHHCSLLARCGKEGYRGSVWLPLTARAPPPEARGRLPTVPSPSRSTAPKLPGASNDASATFRSSREPRTTRAPSSEAPGSLGPRERHLQKAPGSLGPRGLRLRRAPRSLSRIAPRPAEPPRSFPALMVRSVGAPGSMGQDDDRVPSPLVTVDLEEMRRVFTAGQSAHVHGEVELATAHDRARRGEDRTELLIASAPAGRVTRCGRVSLAPDRTVCEG